MATKYIKKIARAGTLGANDVSGLKSSRYEKLQVAYGVIPAGTITTTNDTFVFSDIPSQDIIRATVVAHGASPAVLEVYPGSDNTGVYTLSLPTGVAVATPKFSYVVEYIRGGGRVGPTAPTANAYGSGQYLESGEGDLLTVKVVTSATSAADAEIQVTNDSV